MTERRGTPRAIRIVDPVWIELSDGTRLCARVWLPTDAESDPVPAILEYLPYRKDDVTAADDAPLHSYVAARGYAGVRVDIRGSGDSDGVLLDEYTRQEQDDALEVIAWLADQPWCSGAVGMMGISWGGFNSLQVAARRPPALRAIITACSTDDRYDNDVHYYGGCPLGYYLLPWATVMLAFNARPPDPAIVGDRWREMWLTRLEGNVHLIETWLAHQRRDAYWRQGSVCEDYDAIEVPVLAVSGWADAYVDAIFRMLAALSCPRRAIVGPWGHQWPQLGRPGPAIGFLDEVVRWWDQWLKGIPTGVMDEPMLRAWMQEPVAPDATDAERPGRWVSEPAWPPADAGHEWLRLDLDPRGLVDGAGAPEVLSHHSVETVGTEAGAWCAYGNPGDLPADQRRDDERSLSFDSPPLGGRIELLGRPQVRLRVAADRAAAFVMARICDVAPDGASTLITRAALNLCHAAGHQTPVALTPGEPVDVTIELKSVAYAVPAGHRLRLSLSSSYWPWLWPSPAPVTLSVHTGAGSSLSLPVRSERPDAEPVTFTAPADGPGLAITTLRARTPGHAFEIDAATGDATLRMTRDFSGARRFPNGLEYDDRDPVRLQINAGDPLSARVECERRIEVRRDGWRTRVEVRATMSADADDFHVTSTLEAYEGDARIHSGTFTTTVPRDHT